MRKSIKWALIAHTVAMFLLSTIHVGIDLGLTSIEYINNREFTGGGGYSPGPSGYDDFLVFLATAPVVVYNCVFPLNQWLADGLLVGLISNPVA